MFFFISEVKIISLQMSKFPGNQVPEFLIFSRHDLKIINYFEKWFFEANSLRKFKNGI